MAAVLFQQRTEQLEAWLADRRARGEDIRDEVWEGVYVVMAPAPRFAHARLAAQLHSLLNGAAERAGLVAGDVANIGTSDDYRIPDYVIVDAATAASDAAWLPTALVVGEIRSPGEAFEEKLPFYWARGVLEALLLDPETRTFRWLGRGPDGWTELRRSGVLDLDVAAVSSAIRWP